VNAPIAVVAADTRVLLPLAEIRLDGGTQSRAELSNEVVEEYAAKYYESFALPPVTVFYDGEVYWLADGFHRCAAAKKAGRDAVSSDIKQGSRRDAILFSVGANAKHGLRRTHADKRRAVAMLFGDEEWAAKSDRWIAEKCGVHHSFVNRLRNELSLGDSSERTGQDGKTRKLPMRSQDEMPEEPTVNDEESAVSATESRPHTGGPPRVDHAAREARVRALHDDGLGTYEIGKVLSLAPSLVSKAKVAMGIAETSAGIRLWGDVDRVATTLEGVALQVSDLSERVVTGELSVSEEEIRKCISSLSRSSRTVRQLLNALKRRSRK
jgi:hypothetical protein